MRNLDEFITDYSYDMQNQEFFKKLGRKVETLTVSHMINALRTHGIGIVYIAVSVSVQRKLDAKLHAHPFDFIHRPTTATNNLFMSWNRCCNTSIIET